MNALLHHYSFDWAKNQRKTRKSIFSKKSLLALLSLITIAFLLIANVVKGQTLPTGFNQVLLSNGISNPTVMTFAPDGRIFIAQQTGELRIYKNGALLTQPFVSLTVNSSGERGLLGIAFDPAFATNNFIYLYYTISGGANNRISRFTANGDAVVAGSELIILNLSPLSSATNHNGGTMQFGPDGKLYVGVGENANTAHAQNLDTYHGKVLRINSDGTIPTGNPFTTGSTQRRSVWSYGLRNPYTLTFQPGTGKLFVNDVGQSAWEEINDATLGGKNFGWPSAEGNSTNPAFTNPVYAYGHGSVIGQGCAITGGTFFNPVTTNYPTSNIGKYFFIDYCGNWIDALTLSGSTATRANFGSNIAGFPVSIITGTDGNLYFLSRTNSALYKITYTGSQAPVITNQPQNITVAQGANATFSVTATGTAPITYQWRKSGTNISGATGSSYTITSVTSASAGTYSVVVSNAAGSTTSNNATLTVTQPNQFPNATIVTPAAGATYAAGTTISYSGSANDPEDGTLPASAYTWYVLFYHDTHNHPGPTAPDGVVSSTFDIPNSGETSANVFYRLYLVVTDSQGAKDTAFTDLLPRTSTITVNTNPQGLQIALDGQPFVTPYTVTSVEGIVRTIAATSPQSFNGSTYTFSNWNNGGAQVQMFATPVNDVSYTANYSTSVITTTLNPDADAHVRGGTYSNTNYGSVKTLETKNTPNTNGVLQTYLRFNISSVATNRTSVKLRMYGRINTTSNPSIVLQVYDVISQTWTESTINFANKPASQTTVIVSSTITGTANQYYEWDVTAHINSLRSSGVTSVSLLVKNLTVTTDSRAIFNSKESAANKPELVATGNSILAEINSKEFLSGLIIDNNKVPELKFTVYPNPAVDKVTIKYNAFIQKGIFKMMDLSGKIISEIPVYNSDELNINIGNVNNGIYLLVTEFENIKYSRRLVIKR